jgi:hypothetical protein
LAILAGVTTSNHTASRVLRTLKQLSTPTGPLAFSSGTIRSGFAEFISPYASAYHLHAALEKRDSETAMSLLKRLWAPMADPKGANYTGCFWETLDATGAPALGRVTSLCHGWASGPTGLLSEYVLGVEAIAPGYREWRIAPVTLGLEWASGRLTVLGGEITVAWNATGSVLERIVVISPRGTMGAVVLPFAKQDGFTRSTFRVNGQTVTGNETFLVTGGEPFVLLYDI